MTEQINKAKAIYKKATDENPTDYTVKALAAFGLGLCSEELGNYNEARKIYQGIVDDDNFKGNIVVSKAKLRLLTMNDYEKPIEFKPAPKALNLNLMHLFSLYWR